MEIFQKALLNDTMAILDYLKFGDVNIVDEEGMSLLHYAARGNAMDVANLLLDNYINPNIKDNRGETPLFSVVRYGKVGFLKLLLRKNADLNILNKNEESLLMRAIIKGNQEIIDLILLNSNVNYELKNDKGETLLTYALMAHNSNLFFQILKKAPKLLQQETYLHEDIFLTAIKYQNYEVVNYLLENYQINLYKCDKNLNNSLFYAAAYGTYEIASLLLSKNPIIEGKNLFEEDILTLASKNPYNVSFLFENYQLSYNYKLYLNNYPFHVAIIKRDYDLLSYKALDKNKKDTYGISLLDYAKMLNDPNILKILEN